MAENIGIRISKAGTDVKTGTDANMLMTTKFSIPKAVNWEQIDMDVVGNPYLYPHRAELIPFVLVYATAEGTDKVKANYFNIHDVDNVQVWVSANENNVRVELAGTPDNEEVQIYVFVPEIDI